MQLISCNTMRPEWRREAAEVMGKPGYEDQLLGVESGIAAYAGQFSKSRELVRRASESAQRADEKETAAGYYAGAAAAIGAWWAT